MYEGAIVFLLNLAASADNGLVLVLGLVAGLKVELDFPAEGSESLERT